MKKIGKEPFLLKGNEINLELLDFWRWNQSDLLSNALRGKIAEFIVAKAVNAINEVRIEWDMYDLVTEYGIKIEVKSAAYVQSWQQEGNSKISFGIAPALGWTASTNTYGTEVKRNADVYVFCLLSEQDRKVINPLDLDQWEFFVLSTRQLDHEKGDQKSIGLNSLLKMQPVQTGFSGITEAINKVL